MPVHPTVLRLGFVDHLPADPKALVFPDLKPSGPDNKYGHDWSGNFGDYRKRIGVYRRWLDYHSFRHGVTTKLYDAGVSDGIIDELTGHVGAGESRARYRKRMISRKILPLRQYFDAISKIEWPEINLSQLYVTSAVAKGEVNPVAGLASTV